MPPKLPSTVPTLLLRPSQLPRAHTPSLRTCSKCPSPNLSPISLLPAHHHCPPHPPPQQRTLTTTLRLHKKSGGKKDSKNTVPINVAKTTGLDAFDFSAFEAEIAKAIESLKSEMRGIRAGGLDAEKIEGLRVKLAKQAGVVRVGEVAQVVQRGRVMVVMVGEKEHIKPLTSTLLSSLSITPSPPSPNTPLEVHLPIPPTTTSSRLAASKEASQKGEHALSSIKEARTTQKKKLRAMELGKRVGPDKVRRAEKEMEGVNERAVADVKKVVEEKRRGLERG